MSTEFLAYRGALADFMLIFKGNIPLVTSDYMLMLKIF